MNPHHSPDLFFNKGTSTAIDDVKYLRLATIISVDTVKMVCDLMLGDKTSPRTGVPIPLPMVYPGGGIFAIPSRGAQVVVGIRAMQMPLILAYYPMNMMAPDSYFQMFKQVYGIPENLQEGEVFIRARGDSAKCLNCDVISLLLEWEANVDPGTTIERCPNCNVAALTMDPTSQLPVAGSLVKQVMGSTLRMTPQAELFYQADNIMSPDKGDTRNIFKLYINGQTGEVSFMNAGDISFQSNGQFYIGCQNFILKSETGISEVAQQRVASVTSGNGTDVETTQSKTITALDTLSLNAPAINETAGGFLTQKAADRVSQIVGDGLPGIGGTDSYETGSQTVVVSGDASGLGRLVQIGTSDGKTTSFLFDELDLYGSEIKTIYGTQAVSVVGASSWKVGGILNIAAPVISLNTGKLPVARVSDSAVSTAVSDPAFWAFMNAITTFLAVFQTEAGALTPPMTGSIAAAAVIEGLMPTSIKSLITSGAKGVLA